MFEYHAPAELLSERVILVTGAGSGIGRAAARAYADHGATVILLGRTTAKLEAVYDEIEADGAPTPAIYPMNLEGAALHDFEELAAKIQEEFGRLDGLLHNAALLGPRSPIETFDVDEWFRVLQVNLNAEFLMTRCLLPALAASGAASVAFTSSSVGRRGRAFWGAYGVSKFAVEGLMQTLADEVRDSHGIRVNSINPGATRTNMRAHAYPGENPEHNPAAEDIMPLYLYLMGRDSEHVNGMALNAQSGSPPPLPA